LGAQNISTGCALAGAPGGIAQRALPNDPRLFELTGEFCSGATGNRKVKELERAVG
jgi:hypothetical protein